MLLSIPIFHDMPRFSELTCRLLYPKTFQYKKHSHTTKLSNRMPGCGWQTIVSKHTKNTFRCYLVTCVVRVLMFCTLYGQMILGVFPLNSFSFEVKLGEFVLRFLITESTIQGRHSTGFSYSIGRICFHTFPTEAPTDAG